MPVIAKLKRLARIVQFLTGVGVTGPRWRRHLRVKDGQLPAGVNRGAMISTGQQQVLLESRAITLFHDHFGNVGQVPFRIDENPLCGVRAFMAETAFHLHRGDIGVALRLYRFRSASLGCKSARWKASAVPIALSALT